VPVLDLWLVIAGVVCWVVYRLARRLPRARERYREDSDSGAMELAHPQAPEQRGPERPAPSAGELLTLKQWAFDYERALLEEAMPQAERDRAIRLISREVVPLVGQVRVVDIDDELIRSVGHVLAVQAGEGDARYVARAWAHFVGWVRYYAVPPERRNIWDFLDPSVFGLYDKLMGD
jgi:hypothetical protein